MRRFGMRSGFGAFAAMAALALVGSVGLVGRGVRAEIPTPSVAAAANSAPVAVFGTLNSPTKDSPPIMANDGRIRFQATLSLVRNAETGEAFLLPTEKELTDLVRLETDEFETHLHAQREGGVSAKAQEPQKKEFLARQTATLARIKRDRDASLPLAEKLDFTLVRPLYSEYQRIQNEATEFNYDLGGGAPQWNERTFREQLLKNGGVEQNGRALSMEEIDRLDPLVAEDLGFRLARSLRPDSKRLLFTSPPSIVT